MNGSGFAFSFILFALSSADAAIGRGEGEFSLFPDVASVNRLEKD